MNVRVPMILASASPRRKRLLALAGASFDVIPSSFEEQAVPMESPARRVRRLATGKARNVSENYPDALVIGADTVVVIDEEILEKPENEEQAVEMLHRLSGRTHQVLTGVSLVHLASDRSTNFVEKAAVTFSDISSNQITDYVASGSPLDKAGSYGIQDEGALFVERVEGDFYSVMGLPLNRLHRELYASFDDLLVHNHPDRSALDDGTADS